MTQHATAIKVGITQNFLSQVEAGKREPNRRLLAAIISDLLPITDAAPLIAAVIQDMIPGTHCTITEQTVQVNLPPCSTVSVHVDRTPAVQPILNLDTRTRNTLLEIIHDPKLLQLVRTIHKNRRLKKIVALLTDTIVHPNAAKTRAQNGQHHQKGQVNDLPEDHGRPAAGPQ